MDKLLNIDSLRRILKKYRVPKSDYVLPPDTETFWESAILRILSDGGYKVSFEERGDEYDVRLFDNENDACRYFLQEFFPEVAEKTWNEPTGVPGEKTQSGDEYGFGETRKKPPIRALVYSSAEYFGKPAGTHYHAKKPG
ncbi:hypothetical protein FACS189499_08760 [Clostridia bacterium]|nr:hypothetical protein FACS189499_08760 [Clostridia bacterium]